MIKNEFDKDLFDFFSSLLDSEIEIDLLRKIFSGCQGDEIIEEYIESLGGLENDKN